LSERARDIILTYLANAPLFIPRQTTSPLYLRNLWSALLRRRNAPAGSASGFPEGPLAVLGGLGPANSQPLHSHPPW
jgi:hypothetical protein